MKETIQEKNTMEVIIDYSKRNKMKNKVAPAIEVNNLVIDFGETLAVNNIEFKINKGELVTLLGPSGCGKTTTLNAIAGLLTPTSGDIVFSGRNVTKISPQKRQLGLVFQNYALYPHMSVYKNISFPLYNDTSWQRRLKNKNKIAKHEIVLIKMKAANVSKEEIDKLVELWKREAAITIETTLFLESILSQYGKKRDEAKTELEIAKNAKATKISLLSKETLKKLEELSAKYRRKEINKEDYVKTKLSIKEEYKILKEQKIIESTQELEGAKKAYESIKNEFKDNQVEDKKLIAEAKSNSKNLTKRAKEDINKFIKELTDKYQWENIELNEEQKKLVFEEQSKIKKMKEAIHEAVMEVANKVSIVKNLHKKPTKLSGGQQQRVAIARAIVKRPRVLLMDEPLSNLDAKLRISTREWIKNIVRDLGMTTVFVTHDQEEAMSISDKVICMSEGLVQQVGSPMELYEKPKNLFVARFLGMPEMKIFDAQVTQTGAVKIDGIAITKLKNPIKDKVVSLGMRGEHFEETPKGGLEATISHVEYLGREILANVNIKEHGETKVFLKKKNEYKIGDIIRLNLPKEHVHIFNSKSGERI